MNLLPIDSILLGNRHRQEFDEEYLNELKESIEEEGLFNALVAREEGEGWFLVQGECRLRAIADIYALGGTFKYDGEEVPKGMVPYTTLGDLDPLRAELAECHENMKRRDFTWQENARATTRIFEIRRALAEQAGESPPPISVIAEEVKGSSKGRYHEDTRREIIVSRHLNDPEVRDAKDVNEAFKVLKKKEERAKNEQIAATVGATFTAELHSILHADSVEWLQSAPEGKWDVILTDPPYGMGADEFEDAGGHAQGGHGYKDDEETFTRCMNALLFNLPRITKLSAHLYLFCDIERFPSIRELILKLEGDWEVHRTPLIWHVPASNRKVPWPSYGPRRAYELILYAVRGKRPTTGVYPDVLSFPPDTNFGHSAQKPVALYTELLRRSARAGDTVLDPFAGSGPVIPAAHGLKMTATAVEKDAASYALCIKRAEALKEAPELNFEELMK